MSRRRILRRTLALGVLALLTIGAISAWRLTRQTPSWYRPPDPTDQAVVDLADRAEYRLVEAAQKIRPPDAIPWTVRVEDEQMNAWLSARLPQWVRHDADLVWPDSLGTPQVYTDERGLRLALPINTDDSSAIVTARLVPRFQDGSLRLRLDRVWLGSMGLPGKPITQLAGFLRKHATAEMSETQIQDLLDLLAGRKPIEPVMSLADKRRVRLLDVKLGSGLVDLTCRTLPPRARP